MKTQNTAALLIQSCKTINTKNKLPPTPKLITRTKEVRYLRKKYESRKAQFHLTEDGIAGDFGFWVPKKLVASDDGLVVVIPSWFKIKITQVD